MQIATIMLALGGDMGNTIPKYEVTAAEIAVLNAIHGGSAVHDIEPTGDIVRSNSTELSRIRAIYGGAKDSEDNRIVDILFPGAAARVFSEISELEIDESFFKPLSRAKATRALDHDNNGTAGGSAPSTASGYAAMTVPQLKAYAANAEIDLGEASKKADIIAAIELAEEGDAETDKADEDGVEDMSGGQSAPENLFT